MVGLSLFQLVAKGVLALTNVSGLLTQCLHGLRKLTRIPLSEVLPHGFEPFLSPGSCGQRTADFFIFDGFGCLLSLFAYLVQLVHGLRILWFLILGESLVELIHVFEHASLFVPEPFEFPLKSFPLILILGFRQSRLKFLQTLVEIFLPASQVFEAIEVLQRVVLLGVLTSCGLTLGFIPVVFFGQVELVELLL